MEEAAPRPWIEWMHRHRHLLWPLAVGAFLRIAWALYAARSEPLFLDEFGNFVSGDQHSYWALGESIGAGEGYQIEEWGFPTSYYPVGWPAILGAAAALRNNTPLPDTSVYTTAIIQIAFGVLAILFVYVIARRTCGARVGALAAWIVALFPNLIFAVATYSVELPFIALTLATLTVAVTHDWRAGPPSTGRLIAFGVLLAGAIIVRPFASPLLLGFLFAGISARYAWRDLLRMVLIPAAIVLVSLIPWTIRNAQTLDAFVPLSTNLGDTLCMDRVGHANGTFRWASHDGCADPGLPEAERSQENTKKAIEFVLENPAKEVHLWAMRLYRMMENDRVALGEVEGLADGAFLPDWLRRGLGILADGYFFVVGALAIVGIALVRGNLWRGPERAITFTTAVGLLVIPLLLWGAPRFHVPLEPFMALMAAVTIVRISQRVRPAPDPSTAPAPAPVAQSRS